MRGLAEGCSSHGGDGAWLPHQLARPAAGRSLAGYGADDDLLADGSPESGISVVRRMS